MMCPERRMSLADRTICKWNNFVRFGRTMLDWNGEQLSAECKCDTVNGQLID